VHQIPSVFEVCAVATAYNAPGRSEPLRGQLVSWL